jgi:hypothetical protein
MIQFPAPVENNAIGNDIQSFLKSAFTMYVFSLKQLYITIVNEAIPPVVTGLPFGNTLFYNRFVE